MKAGSGGFTRGLFRRHVGGQVAQVLADVGSVARLETLDLWTRMDARIAELGGADKVRALEKQLSAAAVVNRTPE